MGTVIREKIFVRGMICPSCERTIHQSLMKLQGVQRIIPNYATGTILVDYDSQIIGLEAIKHHLVELNYPPIDPLTKADRMKYRFKSFVIVIFFLLGFVIADRTGIFSLFPIAREDTPLSFLLVIGLFTSVHSIAMCGGINISQTSVKVMSDRSIASKLLPSAMYNTGRVISYTAIGVVVGAVGAAITPSGPFKGSVAIIAGIFMLIMGANMLGIFPVLRRVSADFTVVF